MSRRPNRGGLISRLTAKPRSPMTEQIFRSAPELSGGLDWTIVDAKGDLIAGTAADTVARKAVGADDTILMADAAQATGLKWVAAAAGSTISGTNAAGSADTYARSDHNHALPDLGKSFAYIGAGSHASAAPGANQQHYGQVFIPHRVTLTGIGYWVGATQNGNVKVGLFNAAGTKVAETTATVGQAAANTFQQVAFSSTYAADPGVYYIAIILSSATGTWYRTSIPMGPYGNNAPGSFAIGASITPPTAPASFAMPAVITY